MNMNLQKGQASRTLLILAIVVLVAVILTYLIMKLAEKPPISPISTENEIPKPVYEVTLGEMKFNFQAAINRGNILKVSSIRNKQYSYFTEDITTGEKFIEVTIGAQNMGIDNIEQGAWDIENIIDSEGRNYTPYDQNKINQWLPENNGCGALLRPAFSPTPCTKIYEVSRKSSGLKIRVRAAKDSLPNNLSSGKFDAAILDLIVK
jgi:uncharacterized protein (UPF0333 family)